MTLIPISQLRLEDGRTLYEHNMERGHNIPVGTLVEVKYDSWHGDGCCEKVHARLWVVEHGRDCDGTPLYWLARVPRHQWWAGDNIVGSSIHGVVGGFAEEDLTPIPVTPELVYGTGAPEWAEGEE